MEAVICSFCSAIRFLKVVLYDSIHFCVLVPISRPGAWKFLNKYYLNDLINKYQDFNECQEAGLFSLQLQQIVHCKIYQLLCLLNQHHRLTLYNIGPYYSRDYYSMRRLHWGISCPRQRQYFLLHAPIRSNISNKACHVEF